MIIILFSQILVSYIYFLIGLNKLLGSNYYCIGDTAKSFDSIVGSFAINPHPLSTEEMLKTIDTTCTNGPDGAGCTECDWTGTCYSQCLMDEYINGGGCSACDSWCASCFGPTNFDCFSCQNDVDLTATYNEYVYGKEFIG